MGALSPSPDAWGVRTAEGLGLWVTASSAEVSRPRPGCKLSLPPWAEGLEAEELVRGLGTHPGLTRKLPALQGQGLCRMHEAKPPAPSRAV